MLNVSEISSVTTAMPLAVTRQDPKAMAAEFDAMLLEILLRQSGIFQSMSLDGNEEPGFMSEMFLQDFARNLASQVDLGFGSLLLSQMQRADGEVVK